MPNANIISAMNKLHRATLTLREEWDDARSQWKDEVREEFERNHVTPLYPAVTTAMTGIQQINDVIDRLHKLCSPEEEFF